MYTTTLKHTLLCIIIGMQFSYSQIGIGTTTPQATLDITGKPAISTELDGIIAPRLTGDQLRAKTYTAAQTAAIVYVTAADSAPAGQTIDVNQVGYYYFDGTVWTIIAPQSNDWKITGNANTNASTHFLGTTNDVDLIIKRNSIQSGCLSNNTTSFGVNSIRPSVNTGVHNTAIGQTTLFSNTTGHRNTVIGSGAMTDNETGYQNTAMGRFTLHFNISGYNNMAIGQEAAKWNSTGHDNAAIGFNSLRQNGTGSYNVAIGRSAMAYKPGGDVIVNVGNNNIAIGANAQLPNHTANNQLVLGGAPGSKIGLDNTATTRTIINGIVNPSAGAPSGSGDSGVKGEIRVVGNRLYIYCSDNKWRRGSVTTF